MRVGEVRREGQVLDRGPAGDDTDNWRVEVGVAARSAGRDCSTQSSESKSSGTQSRPDTDEVFRRVVVPNRSLRTVDAGVPVTDPSCGCNHRGSPRSWSVAG